jgi:hypothetical protein
VILTGITPSTAITEERFRGATVELLSDAGAAEEIREIAAADPTRRTLKLKEPLPRPPRQAQRVRVKENVAGLTFDLSEVRYYVRATAFAGSTVYDLDDDQFKLGTLNPSDFGGGGGGGGGGAFWITAGGNITIAGTVSANGGDGGPGGAGTGGNGGGGSGGSILLQARGQLTVSPGAKVSAIGGKGASGDSPGGGQGGNGRIRFEDVDAVPEIQGLVQPIWR